MQYRAEGEQSVATISICSAGRAGPGRAGRKGGPKTESAGQQRTGSSNAG